MLNEIYTTLRKVYSILALSRNRAGILQVEPVIRHSRPGVDAFCLTTMDFGNKSTWYQKSIRTNEYTMTNSGDNKTYTSTMYPWVNIDAQSFTTAERYARKLSDGSYSFGGVLKKDGTFGFKEEYRPVVIKNNAIVSASEYSVNYADGKIEFNSENSPSDIVKASFSYVNPELGSEFIVRPYDGRMWSIEHSELQFSKSVASPMPTVVSQLWGGKSDYSYDYSSQMDYLQYCLYEQYFRNPADYINIGNEGKGYIPAFGCFTNDMLVFPFNYMNSICLGDTAPGGVVVRLFVKDDAVFRNVDMATLAIYIEDRPAVEYV